MAQTASMAVRALLNVLEDAGGGLNAELESRITSVNAEVAPASIVAATVGAELAERVSQTSLPLVVVSCERLKNTLREKFRTFSGAATLSIEVRVTDDHSERADERLLTYLDALTEVLHRARGDWGNGIFYPGEYEIVFGPAKRGGKNTLHAARIRLDVSASV